ncbi:hypothetical protein J2X90_005534 [Variovorax paradoxus]|uniref:hypothetical protein n=1 Tax=Variovorax paradoxus TaxID=34073 RepID=UPI00277E7670|nr:hypothetical protein [Variovorax paradoxus]MDQ0027698.1 hypothetical protein [Variovorax paradoxus]
MAGVLQKTGFGGRPTGLAEPYEPRPRARGRCRETLISHVRRIAVHVDEPNPGHFFWVLTEECDDASHWIELESADLSYDTWLDALYAGVRALQGYAEDPRIGPRALGENEDSNPVG